MADKVILDPAFRRLENIFSPEDLARLHSLVVNDLEAILRGLMPQEMQVAQPEYIRLRG